MEWTLCEDELPEDGEYLVIWKSKRFNHLYYEFLEIYGGVWIKDIPQASGEVDILAWMDIPPLPEELR